MVLQRLRYRDVDVVGDYIDEVLVPRSEVGRRDIRLGPTMIVERIDADVYDAGFGS